MKVLIVDDSLLVRQTLKRFFEAAAIENLRLWEAKDGEAAMSIFESKRPDYMILDMLMPVMDGQDVLRQLQNINHDCDITILSANIQKPVKEKCLALGAKRFIEKPINIEKFAGYLKAAMGILLNV